MEARSEDNTYSACLSAAAMYLSAPRVQAVNMKGGLTPANTPDQSSKLMDPVAGPSR